MRWTIQTIHTTAMGQFQLTQLVPSRFVDGRSGNSCMHREERNLHPHMKNSVHSGGVPKIQVVATTCYNSTTSWGDLYGQFTSEVYPMISRRTPIRRFWVPDFHRLRGEQLGGAKPDTSGCSDRGTAKSQFGYGPK